MVSGKFRDVLILTVLAGVILALCVYKLTRTNRPVSAEEAVPINVQPAPTFELLDSSETSQMVRLASFIGRHRIVLLFFDGAAGADQDAHLLRLRDQYDAITADGTKVIAVSAALPQENRSVFERSGEFPFPLLSDPDFRVHRMWGRYDEQRDVPRQGLFLIDRKGDVAWADGSPRPVDDPQAIIDELATRR